MNTTKVDEQLSPRDFVERLCLVQTSDVHIDVSAVTPGNEVATYQLWPALIFKSYKELQHELKEAVTDKRTIGKITIDYTKLCRTNPKKFKAPAEHGIAYLLGRGKSQSSLVFVPKNSEGEIEPDNNHVFDYFAHVDEMEQGKGYCGSEQFQEAYTIAQNRMEASLDNSESSPSPAKVNVEVKKERTKAATMTTINSAKKTTFTTGPKTFMDEDVEYSPNLRRKKEMEEENKKKLASVGLQTKRKSPRRSVGTNEYESMSVENEASLPMKSVEFSGQGEAVSSPEKPYSDEDDHSETQSEAFCNKNESNIRKSKRASPVLERKCLWAEMYNHMISDGWSYLKGNDLVEWYYLHPTCKGMKKTELMRDKEEGEDYFTSEKDLKTYARLNLGWRAGRAESMELCKSDSPKDAEMADRIKKRRRGPTIKQQQVAKQVEVKPASKAKGGITKSKETAKHTINLPHPNSPSEESAESRFSQSQGDPFHFDSEIFEEPIVSEVGGKPTNKKKKASKRLKFSPPEEEEKISSPSSSENSATGGSSSGSDSSSNQSPVDAAYQVLASKDAWTLLMDCFGFTYHGGKYYCLPGKENRPHKDSSAVEGMNYFTRLEELRKHLCAYGLPELKKNARLSEEEVDHLGQWVRYANVVGLGDARKIDPNDVGEISFLEAWAMLKKLGLKYTTAYMYPNSDPSQPPLRFERQQDFIVHLARFGIPHVDGIQQNEALDSEERFMLDLHIANTEVDSFKRINPNSEQVNEISPRRRTRSSRSDATESELVIPGLKKSQPQVPKKRRFQLEFNKLELHRELPKQLMSSQKALEMLKDNYNISVIKDHYYLPKNGGLAEDDGHCVLGVDYFSTIQEMRENLCAFGLPSIAKGSKLSETSERELDAWVRCANIRLLHSSDESVSVPQFVKLLPKEARKVLKSLGYTLSDSTHTYLLPGTTMHQSRLGQDQFDTVIDLINYIARFGLDDTQKPDDPDIQISEEDKVNFEIFVASVATFDVRNRIKCNAPIRKKQATEKFAKLESAETTSAETMTLTSASHTATNKSADLATTPINRAVVVDEEVDHDITPQPYEEEARPNTITKFFGAAIRKVGDAVASAFSPDKYSRSGSTHADKEEQSDDASSRSTLSNNLSPSCMDEKGDDEIEACFADTAAIKEGSSEESTHTPATPKNQMSKKEQSMTEEISLTVEHYPQAESPTMTFDKLWTQMRKAGWNYCTGSGLVSFYYMHPSVAKMKKGEMMRRCTEGVHYFTSEKSIHRYAHEHLGWKGAGGNIELSPVPPTMSLTSRVKKRTGTNALESDAASPRKKSRTSLDVSVNSRQQTSPTKKRSSPRKRMNESITAASKSDSSVSSRSSSEKEYKAPPDMQPTIKDKLECCQLVLHPSFKKDKLSKSSSLSVVSSISYMEDDIKDFMKKSIQTGTSMDGMTLPSPGFLYICGGPGTGKTTAVKSCTDEMKKWAKRNGHDKPRFCEINMAGISTTAAGLMRAILKKIATAVEVDKEADLSTFEKQFKKTTVVLILDEVDMLFKQHAGSGEACFNTLVEWAENKELRFSMIGISNCINDDNSERIRELGHSPRELVFSAYKEEDIVAILEQRLGSNIVDKKALQLISRRVAASSGDVRRALEITSNAVDKCIDLTSNEKLDMEVAFDDECMPLVKLPHMMRAIREGMPMRHVDVICGLPQAAKVVLCIAVSLSQVWGPTAEISISILKKYCVEATHHAIMDELGPGHVMSLVDMLIDSGLLVTGNSGQFNPHDPNAKLKIGVQLDDVEIALEQSLLKEGGFYKSLVDYVKRECS